VLTALIDLKALLFRENQPPDATFAIVSTWLTALAGSANSP